jgi:hypothetical protein
MGQGFRIASPSVNEVLHWGGKLGETLFDGLSIKRLGWRVVILCRKPLPKRRVAIAPGGKSQAFEILFYAG